MHLWFGEEHTGEGRQLCSPIQLIKVSDESYWNRWMVYFLQCCLNDVEELPFCLLFWQVLTVLFLPSLPVLSVKAFSEQSRGDEQLLFCSIHQELCKAKQNGLFILPLDARWLHFFLAPRECFAWTFIYFLLTNSQLKANVLTSVKPLKPLLIKCLCKEISSDDMN